MRRPQRLRETIEAIAGHLTHQKKKRYSHVRVEARRAALAGLGPERRDRSHMPGECNNDGPVKTGKPMSNEQVLALVEAQLPAKVIVQRLNAHPRPDDHPSPKTLKQLRSGVFLMP